MSVTPPVHVRDADTDGERERHPAKRLRANLGMLCTMFLSLAGLAVAGTVTNGVELVQACNNAGDGDVIVVDATSRLEEHCRLTAKDVTLKAADDLDYALLESVEVTSSARGAQLERLDLAASDTVYSLDSSATGVVAADIRIENTTTQGLTVRDGDMTVDGLTATGNQFAAVVVTGAGGSPTLTLSGAHIHDSAISIVVVGGSDADTTLEIVDSVIESTATPDGETLSYGGAIQIYGGSSVIVRRTRFFENVADSGGAIGAWSNGDDGLPDVIVEDSEFIANSATTGGAIQVSDGALQVSGSHFCANTAEQDGSAIAASDVGTVLLRNTFQQNAGSLATLSLSGATHSLAHLSFIENSDAVVIKQKNSASVLLEASLFYGNTASVDAGYSGGWNAFLGPSDVHSWVESTDLIDGQPGFLDYEPSNCDHRPYIAEDSILVGAAEEGSEDPDGSSPADIGAWWAGAGSNTDDTGTGPTDSGVEPGEDTDEPTDTGEPARPPLETWFSGGCSTLPGPLVSGWLALLLLRRRTSA